MVHRARGELGLVAGSRSYVLRLECWACAAVEADMGSSFETVAQRAQQGRATDLRAVLWTALQARHAEAFPSVATVGPVIDAVGGLPKIQRVIRDLLALQGESTDPVPKGKRGPPVPDGGWKACYHEVRLLGVEGDAFWHLSLKELRWELETAKLKVERAHDQDMRLAWHVAALMWQKELPPLERLLTPQVTGPPDQRLAVRLLSEQLGIPLRRGKKAKQS